MQKWNCRNQSLDRNQSLNRNKVWTPNIWCSILIFGLIMFSIVWMVLVSVVFQFLPLMFDFIHEFICQLTFCLRNVFIVNLVCFYVYTRQTKLFVQIWSRYLLSVLLSLNWLLFLFLHVSKTSWKWIVLLYAEFIVEILDSWLTWNPWEIHFFGDYQMLTLKLLLKLFLFI